MTTIENEFLALKRAIWDLKQACSTEPESAQAIRNGVYMRVAHKVELIANQVYAERAGLQKRIAELEARECWLLKEAEIAQLELDHWNKSEARKSLLISLQRKFAEVNGLKVKP